MSDEVQIRRITCLWCGEFGCMGECLKKTLYPERAVPLGEVILELEMTREEIRKMYPDVKL